MQIGVGETLSGQQYFLYVASNLEKKESRTKQIKSSQTKPNQNKPNQL